MRYSLVVVGAVGDFRRSKTMTAPVDPVETASLSPPSILLPARCIAIRRKGPNWKVLDDIKCAWSGQAETVEEVLIALTLALIAGTAAEVVETHQAVVYATISY